MMGTTLDTAVPCNGCTLCCHGDAIRLLPGDDPSQYATVPHEWIPGALMLDHNASGDCIYLGPTGCLIHDTKPQMCKQMDCRNIAANVSWTKARKLNIVQVWRKGKSMLKEAA